jgi:hypothetical protein
MMRLEKRVVLPETEVYFSGNWLYLKIYICWRFNLRIKYGANENKMPHIDVF